MSTRCEEHPIAVVGGFLAAGLALFFVLGVEHALTVGPRSCEIDVSLIEREPVWWFSDRECHDDYRPAPPSDGGSWCGVRLDDGYPILDDAFPRLERLQ